MIYLERLKLFGLFFVFNLLNLIRALYSLIIISPLYFMACFSSEESFLDSSEKIGEEMNRNRG